MKPLLLNTFDNRGGAAIATYRLHQGLRAAGADAHLLVQSKATADSAVHGPDGYWARAIAPLRPRLDRLATYAYPKRHGTLFSPAGLREDIAARIATIDPDVIHLSWVAGGFLRIETIAQFRRPIVWTLHDMWPFTGGCHYADDCRRFRERCGACPQLQSRKDADLSRRIWQRKHDAWRGVPIAPVAPSRWIAEQARASALFGRRQIEVIPNGIDTRQYCPVDKAQARAAFNLPQDRRLILFSAFNATADARKGYPLLARALHKLAQQSGFADAELLIAGAAQRVGAPDPGFRVHYLGHLDDEPSQVELYSAADLVVAPSMQENLSNVVMESMACGTPVVAFNIGGMPDMIDHRINGYLATPFEPDDLAAGIMWVLEDGNRHARLAQAARDTVLQRFALDSIANRYLALYHSLQQRTS